MQNAQNRKAPGKLMAKNAAILAATSFFLRGAGMFLRIYISNKLGAHGVGLHQLILSVYTLGSGFAISGISAAVTRLTAAELAKGSPSGARLVVRRCMLFSLAAGILSAAALLTFAEPIGAGWLSDPRTVPSLRITALILPVISISSCIRGYFVARRRIGTNSVGQLSEQAARTVLTVVLLKKLLPMGVEYGCVALLLADLIAETVCTVIVSAAYLLDMRRSRGEECSALGGMSCPTPISRETVGRAVWNIAAPITASHYLTSLLRTVESTLVPDCLTIFEGSRSRALELFGMIRGMTLPLILFPATILTAFSSLIVPELSRAQALGDVKHIRDAAGRTLRATFTVGILTSGLLLLYPYELGVIIYDEPELGRIITVLAPFVPLMYADSMAVGILHGLGEQRAPLIYGAVDSVVRIALIALLVPRMGLRGFMCVMAVSNILTPVLNMRRLAKTCGIRPDAARWLAEPALCMALAYAATRLVGRLELFGGCPDIVRVAAGGCMAAVVFALLLALVQEDLPQMVSKAVVNKSKIFG